MKHYILEEVSKKPLIQDGENRGDLPTNIEEEKKQSQKPSATPIIEEVIPTRPVRVLDHLPSSQEFYGGLYLKPFVVRSYLKMEPIFDLVAVNNIL
jgi:hypothetical protein